MDIALWVLVGMVFIATAITLWKGRWQLLTSGFKQAGLTLKSVWFRLLLGFTLGGLLQVLIPSQLIAEWLGPASGLKGILIASYAGVDPILENLCELFSIPFKKVTNLGLLVSYILLLKSGTL